MLERWRGATTSQSATDDGNGEIRGSGEGEALPLQPAPALDPTRLPHTQAARWRSISKRSPEKQATERQNRSSERVN